MRKSIRLSTVGLVPVQEPPPVRNINSKFSLTSFSKRVQHLTAAQRSAIARTGFGNLLSVPNNSLNKVLLTELMEMWSCERRAFVLGSGEMPISLLDVALILGLPAAGKPVALTDDEAFSDLEEEFGATRGKRKVAMSSLEARLDSLGEVVSDDFVRTFLLYTIGTFLSSNDGKVDSRYLCFLGDLGEVSQYAWCDAVVEDLSQWLNKRKENNVKYVGGCLIFLQTWCYEHFDIAQSNLLAHDMTFPRVCRWDNSKSRQQVTSSFKELHDDQIIWKLQPTSAELQIDVIKEAWNLLDDNKELENAENCSTSVSTNVPGVDSESQLSISNEVHRADDNTFENQVVDDTPTRLSSCDDEFREQTINLQNQVIVEGTPLNLSTSNDESWKQAINLENLVILEDTPSNLSICDNEVRRGQEGNLECLIVEDTPTSSSIAGKTGKGQELFAEKLIVEDTPTSSSTADKADKEQEFFAEKLVVEDTPTSSSTADKADKEQEFFAEKLIVEDTPTSSSTTDKADKEQEFFAEKLVVEDTPTSSSTADKADKEQEFFAEKHRVEDTPPELSFYDDDLRKKNSLLEEENAELKVKLGQVMEENELLRRQISSNTQSEVQNPELKKELDLLREENRTLRQLISSYADRMDRHVLDFETSAIE